MATEDQAAFGIYPSSGKRREELNVSRNVNAPLQLARGWLAGTLGIPGDVETLGRLLANFSFGPGGVKVPTESVLPTSEYFQKLSRAETRLLRVSCLAALDS